MAGDDSWQVKGLLFENCNCQVICPGHVHFSQDCSHERCTGYWAIRFDAGRHADVDLGGMRAVIAYDSPRHMIEGGWSQVIIIDREASRRQRAAIDAILTGKVGGPWAVLARFVSRRLPTRYERIDISEDDAQKRVTINGILKSTIRMIRGGDRSKPVTFENMFNQIHDTTQVIARGDTSYEDGVIRIDTRGTHGLWSGFEWSGP